MGRLLFNMNASRSFRAACALALFAASLATASSYAAAPDAAAIRLQVDARDAARGILHADLSVPVSPGPLSLFYPKWIPGEHGPTGPIADVTDLKFTADGTPLTWRRDPEDMYQFHLDVPAGTETVVASFDFLLPPSTEGFSAGASSTAELVDISWNQLILYPPTAHSDQTAVRASLRLPSGWSYGTALPVERESGDDVEFKPVSLTTLVDSPVLAGAHFRQVDLAPEIKPAHYIAMAADSAAALEMTPEQIGHYSQLVAETGALFGARHYNSYHFLLTLSDHVAHFGLEHHESSDNRVPERSVVDDTLRLLSAGLLPHEMVHSWNGKYRRPAGLATPDYQHPMKTEMLWVYEGLTTYLGEVLTVRSGLWTNQNYFDYVAWLAATLDTNPGRAWRPLEDTTVAAQILYSARPEGAARRRGVDFYPEGLLIWLNADVVIRQRSDGKKSLDDFCRAFFGGNDTGPQVVPYTRADLVAALNGIVPYAWDKFFHDRVDALNPRAPLDGVEGAGWKLVYNEEMPSTLKGAEGARKFVDLSFSIGLRLSEDGTISDVIPGMAAEKAGAGAGMKLLGVNGRRWSPERLRAAVQATKDGKPLELLVENTEFFKTCRLDYHDGERYPHLKRKEGKPDLLSEILRPAASRAVTDKREK